MASDPSEPVPIDIAPPRVVIVAAEDRTGVFIVSEELPFESIAIVFVAPDEIDRAA
jgi:hypothetical protein